MRHGACFVRYGGQLEGHDTDAHGCNKGKRDDLRFGGYGAGSRAYFAFKLLCLANCVSFGMSCHRNQDAHIRSVHLWKSSSSCYVPISRYPILSSVRPVHAQPETDEEITEYYFQTTERPKASPPSRLPLPVVTCTDLTLWISLCQIQSARSSVEGHSRHPDCLASSVLMRAHPVDERWGQ